MRETRWGWFLVLSMAAAAAACGDDDGSSGSEGAGGSGGSSSSSASGGGTTVETLTVSGSVIDFQTGMPLTGSATITVDGIQPPPTISVTGADFEISEVPPFSLFHILSGSPPDYRSTYNIATATTDTNVSGIQAMVVSEAFLTQLLTDFGVTPTAGTGTVIAQVVNEGGTPTAGVPDAVFTLNGAPPASGPFFLDGNNMPDPAATETSASGYVVFFDVPAGLVSFGAAMNSGYTVIAADSPTAATTVTLARLVAQDGELVLPTNVSFSQQVVPIFESRGCTICHSGNQPGADLGGLALNGGNNKIYKELTEEMSPISGTLRIDLQSPEQSLVLTMPSSENPPDTHPNVTFQGLQDPDYLTIRGWITEGALEN